MPIDHVGLNVPDLVRAKAYYDQLMPLLEFEEFLADERQFAYRLAGGKIGTYLFFYGSVEDTDYSRHRTGLQHLAFIVRTREAVHAVRDKALELGSEIISGPKIFERYHPNYYAVFWSDPHGFMLEAVCHKPA